MPRNLSDLWLNEWRGRTNKTAKKQKQEMLQDNGNITRLFWKAKKQKNKKKRKENIVNVLFVERFREEDEA